ncbi:hypothetical protein ACFQI7_37655 [Paenibacillus allorhizosphaerae]|uniref:hypothetical protein n=2 Tax=Paenibacillus allorhizosphaerae TaxID=2849866 RepID=UPI00361D6B82
MMNIQRLTFLFIKGVSLYFLFNSVLQLNEIASNIIQRLIYPGLYEGISRNTIIAISSSGIYLTFAVILWIFAKKISKKIILRDEEIEQFDLRGLLQLGIGLIGIYSLVMDISSILWIFRESVAEQYGLEHDEGQFGIVLDLVVSILNVSVSLLLIFKASWISQKLHSIWNK